VEIVLFCAKGKGRNPHANVRDVNTNLCVGQESMEDESYWSKR